MRRLSDLLGDDTNQFGPGTDLTVSLLAVVLVVSLITSHLYRIEQQKVAGLVEAAQETQARIEGGNFRLAAEFFAAADFHPRPVTRVVNERSVALKVERIVRDYRKSAADYPYVFVIGHSNELDDPDAEDRTVDARRRRNMEYALRRAAVITGMLQEQLTDGELERLVVASTGEFDLKDPTRPTSPENAWVEVVFGREWKLPGRSPAQ
jgi:hypothetical protein